MPNMRLAIAVALSLLAAPAQAWDRGCVGGIMPPPEMVGTLPNVNYYVLDFPGDIIRDLCGVAWAPANRTSLGCAVEERPGDWYIYINTDYSKAEQLCTLWHERAHLPPLLWQHPVYRSGPAYHSRRKGVSNVLRRMAEDPR